MTELATFQHDAESRIARLSLNRPDARNAMSRALLAAIDRALDEAEAAAPDVLVICGSGPAFCAGLDLDEAMGDSASIHALLHALSGVLRRVGRWRVPTIAAVRGAAIGGGFGLMLACDAAITHADVVLGYPDPSTGLSGAVFAPWLLHKLPGPRGRRMAQTGGTISGDDARSLGLVTHLAPSIDDVDAEAMAFARRFAASSPAAHREMKRLADRLDDGLTDRVLDEAADRSAAIIASESTQRRLRERYGHRKSPE